MTHTMRPAVAGKIVGRARTSIVKVAPQERAAEVLKKSEEIDARETKMVPFIMQHKSLTKVIQLFNRI